MDDSKCFQCPPAGQHMPNISSGVSTNNIPESNDLNTSLLGNTHGNLSLVWFGLLLLLLFSGCTIGFYLIVVQSRGWQGSDHLRIIRSQWNTQSNFTKNLIIPCRRILLTRTTSLKCRNHLNCYKEIYSLQKYQATGNKTHNIPYNFIIGPDEEMYEVLGWKYVGTVSNYRDDATVIIAFMELNQDNPPTVSQVRQLEKFIKIAMTKKKLSPCFSVLTQRVSNRHLIDIAFDIEKAVKTC